MCDQNRTNKDAIEQRERRWPQQSPGQMRPTDSGENIADAVVVVVGGAN